MNIPGYTIRNAYPTEFDTIGQLPKETEQPGYYNMLANVGTFTNNPGTELLIAVSDTGKIAGAVVYFNDMQFYGSGGIATLEKDAAGFRLLAVDPGMRGKGIGKRLSIECINKARKSGVSQVIIHTTAAMQTAWKMYEGLGFRRSEDLDFMQGDLPVFGLRVSL